jgi:hypothetical protein
MPSRNRMTLLSYALLLLVGLGPTLLQATRVPCSCGYGEVVTAASCDCDCGTTGYALPYCGYKTSATEVRLQIVSNVSTTDISQFASSALESGIAAGLRISSSGVIFQLIDDTPNTVRSLYPSNVIAIVQVSATTATAFLNAFRNNQPWIAALGIVDAAIYFKAASTSNDAAGPAIYTSQEGYAIHAGDLMWLIIVLVIAIALCFECCCCLQNTTAVVEEKERNEIFQRRELAKMQQEAALRTSQLHLENALAGVGPGGDLGYAPMQVEMQQFSPAGGVPIPQDNGAVPINGYGADGYPNGQWAGGTPPAKEAPPTIPPYGGQEAQPNPLGAPPAYPGDQGQSEVPLEPEVARSEPSMSTM